MAEKTALILASHGDFSKGSLSSLKVIIGDVTGIQTVSIYEDTSNDEAIKMLEECYEKVKDYENVIILVDLICGTPCNVASRLYNMHNNISIICGYNLPILITLVLGIQNQTESLLDLIDSLKSELSKSFNYFAKDKKGELINGN